jgi:hypothetical protein
MTVTTMTLFFCTLGWIKDVGRGVQPEERFEHLSFETFQIGKTKLATQDRLSAIRNSLSSLAARDFHRVAFMSGFYSHDINLESDNDDQDSEAGYCRTFFMPLMGDLESRHARWNEIIFRAPFLVWKGSIS